jgi:hypothetical protein
MKHFEMSEWVDYVRGLTPPSEAAIMARHLSEGCESCAALVGLVGRIREESAAETNAPDSVVAAAKAVFPVRPSSGERMDWLALPRLTARLIFDNISGAAVEGARSALESTVQLVYHAGDYTIELQIEQEPESTRLAVVGQVFDRAGTGKPLSGAPVALMARNQVVTESATSRFGEFCLVSRMRSGLSVCMQIENIGKRVQIPLNRIMAGRG